MLFNVCADICKVVLSEITFSETASFHTGIEENKSAPEGGTKCLLTGCRGGQGSGRDCICWRKMRAPKGRKVRPHRLH